MKSAANLSNALKRSALLYVLINILLNKFGFLTV